MTKLNGRARLAIYRSIGLHRNSVSLAHEVPKDWEPDPIDVLRLKLNWDGCGKKTLANIDEWLTSHGTLNLLRAMADRLLRLEYSFTGHRRELHEAMRAMYGAQRQMMGMEEMNDTEKDIVRAYFRITPDYLEKDEP